MKGIRSFKRKQRGAYLIFFSGIIVVLLAAATIAIDVSVVRIARAELATAIDAGALAAAGELSSGNAAATNAAIAMINKYKILGSTPPNNIHVEQGRWDPDTKTFTITSVLPTAVRITADYTVPFFIAPFFGKDNFDLQGSTVATNLPRDILLVLDLSASMNDDSELISVGTLGLPAVEASLLQIYHELGSPVYGSMQWTPQKMNGSASKIKSNLGLDSVPYPYPAGSWTDYINYVKNDPVVNAAGLSGKYGYLTLVNYWLHVYPAHNQTPDLWMTSAQPMKSVREAVDSLYSNILDVDKVGLITYNGPDGNALTEQTLTFDTEKPRKILQGDVSTGEVGRQAGHYSRKTNIANAIETALEEFKERGRSGSGRQLVLLTDGRPTYYNGSTDEAAARAATIAAAEEAKKQGIPIFTISLGQAADTALMQQIADITGGYFFDVADDYEAKLNEVFHRIGVTSYPALVK